MALKIVVGDVTIGVHGEDFSYIFSAATGGLESLKKQGKEWLYRTPKPAFWRAATDNDRGNGFAYNSAAWMAADCFIRSTVLKVLMDGEEVQIPAAPANNRFTGKEMCGEIILCYTYETATTPRAKVEITYHVEESGRIGVEVHYFGQEGLPELPVFGMRFIMPTAADGYTYEGLSGETYPDRMAGGIPGVYEVSGMPVTPYLVPQDCGVHMQTKWLEVRRTSVLDNTRGERRQTALKFGAYEGEEFAFSCLPYTALELENATHHEELPPVRRTVVSILGAVRGVGGIDSWGADVEKPYHISAQEDIRYRFWIR